MKGIGFLRVFQPIYRLVMMAAENTTLQNSRGRVNDERNATFIVHDPSRGIDVDNGDLASFNLDDETVSILFRENLFVGGENIDAAHVRDNGNIILSTASGATLGSNALRFRDGDLVEYDPVEDTAWLIFSEDAFGSNEDIDAIWVKEDGGRITELILSTDGTFTTGGVDYLNGDLVKIVVPEEINLNETSLDSLDGLSITRVFSEALFVGGANIDGV
ncbi:MAG: hypothetical protein IIA08_05780, partial [Proteobacteria bacterium]|nr:hypothetical protein [Pseudomonadota bacterium]